MNPVLIVLPILLLLMFDLGLEFKLQEVAALARQPKALWIGLFAQIVILPLIAIGLGYIFRPEPYLFVGLVLIACSPGGSSSNIFSLIAKGDVPLSVTLTMLSSIITVFTIPPILTYAMEISGFETVSRIRLPAMQLFVQNVILILLPIALGMVVKKYRPRFAGKAKKVLDKSAFPALLLLATVFFISNREVIVANFSSLTLVVTILILIAMGAGALLAILFGLQPKQKRTIVIEVGMQNSAQAIAIAGSPFVLNNDAIAVPAIVYALMMNIILLAYISKYLFAKKKQTKMIQRQLSIIVAIDEKNGIGRNGNLLCHLPNDLKHFKNITSGHTVVMGRRTFQSLPKGALPDRTNIVVTSGDARNYPGCIVVRSLAEALQESPPEKEIFIIGGGQLYRTALPVAHKLYLTRIHHTFTDADTFFPETDPNEWETIEQQEGTADQKHPHNYTFLTCLRKERK